MNTFETKYSQFNTIVIFFIDVKKTKNQQQKTLTK